MIAWDAETSTPHPDRYVWLGALSFEERCLGSLESLLRAGGEVEAVHLVDYTTRVRPRSDAAEYRAIHLNRFEGLVGRDRIQSRRFAGARYVEGLRFLSEVGLHHPPDIPLMVDATCLTKLHATAVAYMLLSEWRDRRVVLAFSYPNSYGPASSWQHGRWKDVVQVRLDLDSEYHHRGAEGIAVMGHEGDRLRLGLHEVQPEALTVVQYCSPDNRFPEAQTVAEIQNAELLNSIADGSEPRYELAEVGDLVELSTVVAKRVESARLLDRRLVLFPLGPKWLVLYTAYEALRMFMEGTWACYPVVSEYDVKYSIGYGFSRFFGTDAA